MTNGDRTMKTKRAIEKLKNLRQHCKSMINDSNPEYKGIWEGDCKALDVAISALEKRIPAEPIDVSKESYATPGTRFDCPFCGAYLGHIQFNGKKKYCLYCGQALKLN